MTVPYPETRSVFLVRPASRVSAASATPRAPVWSPITRARLGSTRRNATRSSRVLDHVVDQVARRARSALQRERGVAQPAAATVRRQGRAGASIAAPCLLCTLRASFAAFSTATRRRCPSPRHSPRSSTWSFPPRCPLCGDGLTAQVGLCAPCWSELEIPGTPPAQPASALSARTWPRDRSARRAAKTARATTALRLERFTNDASRRLVLAFKHGRALRGGDDGSADFGAVAQIGTDWLVVQVPLHRWRLWRRGFNQAAFGGRSPRRAGPGWR